MFNRFNLPPAVLKCAQTARRSAALGAAVMLALVATGCGQKEKKLEVPSEVMPYVQRFESQSRAQGTPLTVDNLVIRFQNLPNANENGVCEIAGDQTPQVTINNSAWASMDDAEREQLVFHECGHCVLRRRHRDDFLTGFPASVMYTFALDSWTYTGRYANYQFELFSRRNEF